MAQRDADPFEVRLAQIRQDFGVDVILAKQRLVLAQPKAPTPFPDIHGLASDAFGRGVLPKQDGLLRQ
jgi:hypothetical protein